MMQCTNPLFKKQNFVATGGEGSPMCEANLDAKFMYMMFNVVGKLISNLVTPTTIGPYNLVTPIIQNSPTTSTILLSYNASGHCQMGLLYRTLLHLHMCNNATKKGMKF